MVWGALMLPLLWFAAALAQAGEQGVGLSGMLEILNLLIQNPFQLRWCANTGKLVLAVLILYPMGVYAYMLDQADRHPGEEHGSAQWGDAKDLDNRYRNKEDEAQNIIFTENIRFSMNSFYHQHNLNVMVVGGSGAGKSRKYVKPNALQNACSYFFLDPKGELTRSLGDFYEEMGTPVTVLDLVHFQGHYNPMAYLEDVQDVMKLANAIVKGSKEKEEASGGDSEFWDQSAIMLISAYILYLKSEAPPEDQNLSTVALMIANSNPDPNGIEENLVEAAFKKLTDADPVHPAVLQYKSFALSPQETRQSILVTAASRLQIFNTPAVANMTDRDEMFLPELGMEKRVIFCIIPDNDSTYNFLVTILYTQLFDQLFRCADDNEELHGSLPSHVRIMMDEFANVALPKDFKKILSVCRSRNISCDIILQSIAQLKSLFKDDWEGLVGNCDSFLYLGGNEYGTFEYISKILGKETERTTSQSIGKGNHGSSSESIQSAGRDLCAPDEIRRMKNEECLLLMRSEAAVIDRKYDLLKHPNVHLTPDKGGKSYVIPPDYMSDAMTITLEFLEQTAQREISEDLYDEIHKIEQQYEKENFDEETESDEQSGQN